MKTVFLNPFLPTDLNEKVTSVSFKISSFDYIAKHANVKTTEIDFDKRIIQINDDLDLTASLRELVRAFFIIVAYELNLNAEFPNGKKAHLDNSLRIDSISINTDKTGIANIHNWALIWLKVLMILKMILLF